MTPPTTATPRMVRMAPVGSVSLGAVVVVIAGFRTDLDLDFRRMRRAYLFRA